MKKLTKTEKRERRYDKFYKEHGKNIERFLKHWNESKALHNLIMIQNQLWDEIQDSTEIYRMQKLRERYIAALYRALEQETRLFSKHFPY